MAFLFIVLSFIFYLVFLFSPINWFSLITFFVLLVIPFVRFLLYRFTFLLGLPITGFLLNPCFLFLWFSPLICFPSIYFLFNNFPFTSFLIECLFLHWSLVLPVFLLYKGEQSQGSNRRTMW